MSLFKAGSLASYIHCWQDLVTDNDFLSLLKDGVRLPLKQEPPSIDCNNYYMPITYAAFVTSEIAELLASGAIEKCQSRPHCISPITYVPKKGNRLRLVIDLRKLNEHIQTPSFKYEDINIVLDQIQQGDKLISLDLRNGFQHVLVHPADRNLLGFRWQNIWYRFCVLPFGLSCSPYFFCKILCTVSNFLREHSMWICIYMDDILLMAKPADIMQHHEMLLLTLQRLAWKVNWDKSSLTPANIITYIGYQLQTNSLEGFPVLRIPAECIRKLRKDIRCVLLKSYATAHTLARLAGQCISMVKAILPA